LPEIRRFTYKGKAVNVQEIGRDMGVRYALEGSVRKAGQRVRITAQLIDAEPPAVMSGPTATTATWTISSPCRTT
jgi:TolB-like protein